MVNRSNSERLRGFCDGLMDRQTDGRTFAILESLLQLKNIGLLKMGQCLKLVQTSVTNQKFPHNGVVEYKVGEQYD